MRKSFSKATLKIVIIMVSLNDAGSAAIAPAMGALIAAFPEASPFLVQGVSTVPALLIAFSPLLYGAMADRTRKRTWLWIASICFVLAGIAPAIFNSSLMLILFFRAIFGIGVGILTTLSSDLVVDFFDGQERQTMMGLNAAMIGVSSVLFQLLAGRLSAIDWTYTFWCYLISIVLLAVPLIMLPEPEKQQVVQKTNQESKGQKAGLVLGVYVICLLFLVFYIGFYVFTSNGALVLLERNLCAPEQTGIAFSIMSVTSIITGIAYGLIFKVLKYNLIWIANFVAAAALYFVYIADSLLLFCIGGALIGIAFGVCAPCVINFVVTLVAPAASSKAVSFTMFCMGIGGFLQPIVFSVFGERGYGQSSFIIGTIMLVVSGALSLISVKAFKAYDRKEDIKIKE